MTNITLDDNGWIIKLISLEIKHAFMNTAAV